MRYLAILFLLVPFISFAQTPIEGGRTFYFHPNGTNTVDCTVQNPCNNLQTVYDHIRVHFRLITGSIVFQLADGTYDGMSLQANGAILGQPSPQQFQIIGNVTNPAAVVIKPTGTRPSFSFAYGAMAYLEGVKMDHSNTSQDMILIGQYSSLRINNVEFGYNFNPYNHISVQLHGYLEVVGSYKISGGGQCHILLGNQATTYFATNGAQGLIGVEITGNPDFLAGFLYLASNSSANIQAIEWNGTATGRKFVVEGNSTLDIGGTYLCDIPGNQPGLIKTGGVLLTHPGDFVQ